MDRESRTRAKSVSRPISAFCLDLPTIGVAKSPLAVKGPEPSLEPGDWTEWKNRRGEVVAAAVRTKKRSNPLYISPGHGWTSPPRFNSSWSRYAVIVSLNPPGKRITQLR